jgi:hypothetical protein
MDMGTARIIDMDAKIALSEECIQLLYCFESVVGLEWIHDVAGSWTIAKHGGDKLKSI